MSKKIASLSFICLFLFSCFQLMAQGEESLIPKRTFKDDIINQLKNTKTVFFCKKNRPKQLDSIKQALTSAWDLTPLIFDDIDNFDKYAGDPNYSYFDIEGLAVINNGYSNTYYYLVLRLFKDVSRKGKVSTNGLCRIELYPNMQTMLVGEKGRRKDDVIGMVYENGTFYNWSPILLKAQIGVVSSNLKNNLRPWLFGGIKNENLSQLLSTDTLYVPKDLLMSFGAFTGKEKEMEKNVFENYKNPYRICTDAELWDIFQNQKRGRFLFEYVKSSTDKFVTIYDLKEKNIVYKHYVPISYNLKSKDIDKIDK